MPIISFSISENLRRFLKKLVNGGHYKNSSIIMREALTNMMNSYSDIDNIEINTSNIDSPQQIYNITGNIMIIIDKYNESIEKKLARIEMDYNNFIKGKFNFTYKQDKTNVFIFEGPIDQFQLFIAELNQIEELKNIRYVLV